MINLQEKRILVVVAHPDDEILGIGATMHHIINNNNCIVEAIILSEGITSRSEDGDFKKLEKTIALHKENIKNAQAFIGYKKVTTFNFPDNKFDAVALLDIIKVIEKEKERFNPDIIFTHHGGDLNIDHQKTFDAVVTSSRPMENESLQSIITFETPSGTEWRASSDPRHFTPNFYFELTEENMKAKINAMECYINEKRPYPHPRSPEALSVLAQQRGLTVGLKFAEAFMIIRHILRKNNK